MAVPFQAASGLAGGSGSSRTVTIAAATGTGDTLLTVVAVNNTTCTVSACADSKGNVWTLDRSFTSANPALYAFRAPGGSGGPGGAPTVALTTSDTVTLTTAAVAGNVDIYVVSVPGVGAVDQIAALTSGTSTTGSVSATPAANNETAVSYWATANAGGAPTVNSPFTSLGSFISGSNPYDTAAYDVLTGGSGVALTSTVTITSANWRGGMWTFQPGSTAGSATAGVATALASATAATVSVSGAATVHPAAAAAAASAADATVTVPTVGTAPPVVTPLVLPKIIVEAALTAGNPVSGAGTMTLNDASFGLLDTDWLATADAYADISSYVLGFTITRGSARTVGPVLVFQAGTASITLDNSTGIFDPDNAAGPYYGQIHAMVPVRIRSVFNAGTYGLYRGFADGWTEAAVSYSAGYSEWTLSATDGFKILAGITLPTRAVPEGVGEDAGARISRILDAASWYTGQGGGARFIDTGDQAVQATAFGDTALNLAQIAADSEVGLLYIDGTGAVTFRHRRALIGSVPVAAFGDQPAGTTELAAAAIARADDDTIIANDIQATSVGLNLQEVTDAASIAMYRFPRTFTRSDLILPSDVDTLSWASWVLYIAKTSEDRFEAVTIDPAADPDNLWPQVLGRDMGDRITVTRRPPQGSSPVGAPVTRDCFIAGISHTFDAVTSAWSTVWTLADASRFQPPFTLDDTTLGRLNHNSLTF